MLGFPSLLQAHRMEEAPAEWFPVPPRVGTKVRLVGLASAAGSLLNWSTGVVSARLPAGRYGVDVEGIGLRSIGGANLEVVAAQHFVRVSPSEIPEAWAAAPDHGWLAQAAAQLGLRAEDVQCHVAIELPDYPICVSYMQFCTLQDATESVAVMTSSREQWRDRSGVARRTLDRLIFEGRPELVSCRVVSPREGAPPRQPPGVSVVPHTRAAAVRPPHA